ncbi:MAG: hypothetical protein AABY22_35645 [Nanoarchaeota archaeon]
MAKLKGRALPRRERGPQCFSTSYPQGMENNKDLKGYVNVTAYRKLENKYLNLFKRYKRNTGFPKDKIASTEPISIVKYSQHAAYVKEIELDIRKIIHKAAVEIYDTERAIDCINSLNSYVYNLDSYNPQIWQHVNRKRRISEDLDFFLEWILIGEKYPLANGEAIYMRNKKYADEMQSSIPILKNLIKRFT